MVETEPCELPKWKDATPFGRGTGLGFAAQADHQVCADVVGGSGALGIRRAAVGRPGQEGLHTDGGHPPLEPTRQVPQHICFADGAARAVA